MFSPDLYIYIYIITTKQENRLHGSINNLIFPNKQSRKIIIKTITSYNTKKEYSQTLYGPSQAAYIHKIFSHQLASCLAGLAQAGCQKQNMGGQRGPQSRRINPNSTMSIIA